MNTNTHILNYHEARDEAEQDEIEDEERCEDCGCTPDEGACFRCKMD